MEMKLNKKNIWVEKQNKPSLVVKDLSKYISPDIVYESLLRRGVFKWLAVRRDLIKLKNIWKDRIKKSLEDQDLSYGAKVHYYKGYRKALEECRAEVRALCHSERFQCPDFDKKANKWLKGYKNNE